MVRFASAATGAIATATLFAFSSSAQAEQAPAHDSAALLAAVENPERVDAMANALGAMTEALMAMPVGPLVNAARQMDPNAARDADEALPDDATIADLASRDDPHMAERMGDNARAATHVMAGMAGQMVRMMPMFEAMARDMAAQFEGRMADARRRQR